MTSFDQRDATCGGGGDVAAAAAAAAAALVLLLVMMMMMMVVVVVAMVVLLLRLIAVDQGGILCCECPRPTDRPTAAVFFAAHTTRGNQHAAATTNRAVDGAWAPENCRSPPAWPQWCRRQRR